MKKDKDGAFPISLGEDGRVVMSDSELESVLQDVDIASAGGDVTNQTSCTNTGCGTGYINQTSCINTSCAGSTNNYVCGPPPGGGGEHEH